MLAVRTVAGDYQLHVGVVVRQHTISVQEVFDTLAAFQTTDEKYSFGGAVDSRGLGLDFVVAEVDTIGNNRDWFVGQAADVFGGRRRDGGKLVQILEDRFHVGRYHLDNCSAHQCFRDFGVEGSDIDTRRALQNLTAQNRCPRFVKV